MILGGGNEKENALVRTFFFISPDEKAGRFSRPALSFSDCDSPALHSEAHCHFRRKAFRLIVNEAAVAFPFLRLL